MDFNLANLLAGATEYLTQYGLSVIGAIALLIVGRIVAAWGRGISRRALTKADVDPTLVAFFAKAIYYLILIVVLIAVLGLFGVQPPLFQCGLQDQIHGFGKIFARQVDQRRGFNFDHWGPDIQMLDTIGGGIVVIGERFIDTADGICPELPPKWVFRMHLRTKHELLEIAVPLCD